MFLRPWVQSHVYHNEQLTMMNPFQGSSFWGMNVIVPQYRLSLTATSISTNYSFQRAITDERTLVFICLLKEETLTATNVAYGALPQ